MNSTPGLEELKRIFDRTCTDGEAFARAIQLAGYRFREELPFGQGAVMEREDDRFSVLITSGGVRELVYRCDRLGLTVSLVREGRRTY
jgi:hypothetical protein